MSTNSYLKDRAIYVEGIQINRYPHCWLRDGAPGLAGEDTFHVLAAAFAAHAQVKRLAAGGREVEEKKRKKEEAGRAEDDGLCWANQGQQTPAPKTLASQLGNNVNTQWF